MYRDRQADRDGQPASQPARHIEAERQTDRHTGRQKDRETDGEKERQTVREKQRQIDKDSDYYQWYKVSIYLHRAPDVPFAERQGEGGVRRR